MFIQRVQFINYASPKTSCKKHTPSFKGYDNNNGHSINSLVDVLENGKHLSPPVLLNYNPNLTNKLMSLRTKHPVTIGVTGESASGKTTLTEIIKDFAFENNLSLSLINCDNYYNDLSYYYKQYGGYPQALLAGEDLESPKSFNLQQMKSDLDKLKNNETVRIPRYEFGTGISIPNFQEVKPTRILLIEGIIANNKLLQNNLNVYVDCSEKVQLQRAMKRAQERGANMDDTKAMWNIVKASAKKYITPLKKEADIILNGETIIYNFRQFLENILYIFKKQKF